MKVGHREGYIDVIYVWASRKNKGPLVMHRVSSLLHVA